MAKQRDLLSVIEAAAILKVSRIRVLQYIDSGRLSAEKIGRFYVIKRSDVAGFEKRAPGRPPKGKKK